MISNGSDSGRVHCCVDACTSILRPGIVYLSFKITVNETEWSDSERVDCWLCGCIHLYTASCHSLYISQNYIQWLILNGRIVGGLTVDCVDACLHHHTASWHSLYTMYQSKLHAVVDIEWSDSRRADCGLCGWMHSSHDIVLQACSLSSIQNFMYSGVYLMVIQ